MHLFRLNVQYLKIIKKLKSTNPFLFCQKRWRYDVFFNYNLFVVDLRDAIHGF